MWKSTDRMNCLDSYEAGRGEIPRSQLNRSQHPGTALRGEPSAIDGGLYSGTQRQRSPEGRKPVFFGVNPRMRELQTLVGQIGASQVPVLIEGETGVGKEVLARELHAQSACAPKRFLKLNCAALPSELVESELFGYERGAFTGAFQRKLGMFELADGGTIFLDEIGDMEFKLQAKLLQVLQDQEFHRLGGREAIRVDVRVIAATHCDLERAIFQGRFREDLYYRLSVVNLQVPPLRERREDLIAIAEFLINKHSQEGSRNPVMSPALRNVLLTYSWPGNIRELENVMRKFLIFRDSEIVVRDLQQKMKRSAEARAGEHAANSSNGAGCDSSGSTILGQVTRAKQDAERSAILAALNSTQWNRKKAALLLKIDYKALLYKMKTLSIDDKMAALPMRSAAAG